MAHMLSVRVQCTGDKDTVTVIVPKNSLVDDLIKAVFEKVKGNYESGMRAHDLLLYYGSKPLVYGQNKRLTDYELTQNGSMLVMGVRSPGGIWPPVLRAVKEQSRTLTPLPGFITVTSTEPDVISLDDSTDELRAKMPCGHVISPASMTTYCYSLLDQSVFTFPCPVPGCGRIWDYFMVRHVACLTTDEMAKFEAKVAEKYMRQAAGFQQCPGCKTLCCRADRSNIRVHCRMCSKKTEQSYDFCWACAQRWLTGGTDVCGNPGCDGKDPRLRILQDATRKEINKIDGVPSVRACPQCGLLIHHSSGCRHMTCTSCSTKFCFICLKLKECELTLKCPVAPPQTTITGG